jgi:ribosomal protein S18 acetylase RimI-like enzyme
MVTSTAPGWSVRPATTADAPGIAIVHVKSWQQTYAHLVPAAKLAELSVELRAAAWSNILAECRTSVWVATRGSDDDASQIVGWASTGAGRGSDMPRPVELEGLYVLAELHGRGVGQALLDTALGSNPASLWVAADNPRSHTFYRKNGFEPDGVTDTYPLLGMDIEVVRLMR